MAQGTDPLVLVVGASRGLGLGLAQEFLSRGWRVIGTERAAKPSAGLRDLAERHPGKLAIETVDVDRPAEVAALRAKLDDRQLDLLFVNAGVALDPKLPIGEVSTEDWNRVLQTNALSALRVIESFGDLVRPNGTIAAMSSRLASVRNNEAGGWEIYRASKAALNTLVRSYAARSGGGRTILLVAPGWVRTDMGGPSAPLDIETSTRGVVDAVIARQGQGAVAFIDFRNRHVAW